jgi:hypothetical protein
MANEYRIGDWVRLKATGEEFDVKAVAEGGLQYHIQSRARPVATIQWANEEELEIVLRWHPGTKANL